MGPTGRHGILQIHPTRRCNLRCLHCYSSSGPEEHEELAADLVAGAIEDAARLGFTVVSGRGKTRDAAEQAPPSDGATTASSWSTPVSNSGSTVDMESQRLRGRQSPAFKAKLPTARVRQGWLLYCLRILGQLQPERAD